MAKGRMMASTQAPWWQGTAFVAIAAITIIALVAWALVASSSGDSERIAPIDQGTVALDGETQVLRMTATDTGYSPNEFRVAAGKPVRLIIDSQARGCANAFTVPEFGISERLVPGDGNVFEFTPGVGTHKFSCSMGMFTGVIIAT